MSEAALRLETQWEIMSCGKEGCDAVFAVPAHVYQRYRITHEIWYCPNGHPRCYSGKSELEAAQAEAARLERIVRAERDQNEFLRRQNEAERHRTRAQKAAKTRLKNRIHAGVCPHCNRTFANVARHMKSQHAAECEAKP